MLERQPSKMLITAAALTMCGSGCSLMTTELAECKASLDCRNAYGLGSVCRSDGLCEVLQIHPRCTKTFPEDLLTDPLGNKDRIVIGSIMQRGVGLFAKFELAARLAFKQANLEGGTDDGDFGVVLCNADDSGPESALSDDLTGTDAAVAVADYLSDVIGVPAIFGPATSSDTQEAFLAVRDKGVLVISPSATSNALTDLDPPTASDEAPGLLWRTAPPDSFQGEAMAYDMRSPGAGRSQQVATVAAIHEIGAYGAGLIQVFATAFQAQGGTVTQKPFENANDRDQFVTEAGADPSIDEVLFVSSQIVDEVAFLDAAAAVPGYDAGKGIFLSDAAATDDVLSGASPSRHPLIRGTRPKPLDRRTDLVYSTFLASYMAEYGEDVDGEVFTSNSYDAAWLIAYGVSWALANEGGEITGTTIARGLRHLSSGQPLDVGPTSWVTLQQQFAAGKGVNITGASGVLDFDDVSEETSTEIEVWTVSDAKIVPAYTWPP